MCKFFVTFLTALLCGAVVESTIFTRCQLKSIFESASLGGTVNDWICLVENESGRNSGRKSSRNSNGSYDYGLFQINSKYWCNGEGTVSNDCGQACTSFLDNNINNDMTCAKKIYNRHGYTAWYAWRRYCQGQDLSRYSAGC